MTTPEPVEADKKKMLERAQAYEQQMMHNFQMELGRLSGQAIVDRTAWEQKEADWTAERDQLVATIEALSERLTALEGAFPAQPGDTPSAQPSKPKPPRKAQGHPKKGTGR